MKRSHVSTFLFIAIAAWFAGTDASAATCPYARIVPASGTSYVARVFGRETYDGALDVTFFTATSAFAAHIPTFAVATSDADGYRSETVRFQSPTAAPFEAADVSFPAATSTVDCTGHLIIGPSVRDPQLKVAIDELDPGLAAVPLLEVIASRGSATCRNRYRDARTDGPPAVPQYPLFARDTGETGRVSVRVALNADGSVASTSIYHSSGFADLDQAALNAAAQTRYSAQIFRCEPIAVVYLFITEFSGRR